MPNRSTDPVGNYNFLLEVNGLETAQFTEVSGLSLNTEVIRYRTGGTLDEQKLPGRHTTGDITLKRGYTTSTELWDWYRHVLEGNENLRRDAVIKVLDEKLEVFLRFELRSAWPRKYSGPLLNAAGNEVAIEEIVLVSEAIRLVT